jgi:hypothetical protein
VKQRRWTVESPSKLQQPVAGSDELRRPKKIPVEREANKTGTGDRRRPEENPEKKVKRQTGNEEGEGIVRPELTVFTIVFVPASR